MRKSLPGCVTRSLLPVLLLAAVATIPLAPTRAQDLPGARLQSVFPPGGKAGSSLEVSVAGEDLEGATALRFTHPGIKGEPVTRPPQPWEDGPQVVPGRFKVTIAPNVPPGVYEVQVVGRYGLSNPRLFQVDSLEELNEKEANSLREQAMPVPVPVVINGQLNGGTDVDWFKFQAKKGQRLLIDLWARRIDSVADGTLLVTDSQGRELAFDRDTNDLDPLVDLVIPADGEYYVKLYDFTYGGGTTYFYRLKISSAPYIDFVLPPAVPPGQKAQVTLFGRNLPGGQDAGIKYRGRSLQKLTVTVQAPSREEVEKLAPRQAVRPLAGSVDFFWYQLTTPQGASNPVRIGLASAPVIMEKEPNDQAAGAQKVQVPCELVGQFQRARDMDWFTFQANAGEVYYIEGLSQRQGLGSDLYLMLQQVTKTKDGKEQVRMLAEVDDFRVASDTRFMPLLSDDPVYRFQVPATGTYRLLVRDLYFRGGNPRLIYRVAIRPAQPDFRVLLLPRYPTLNRDFNDRWNLQLRPGDTEVLEVFTPRQDGFAGEITVTVQGLPPGVRCPEVVLGPAQSRAQLVFISGEDAKPWQGAVQVVAKARIGDREVVRSGRPATLVWRSPQQNTAAVCRLSSQVTLAVLADQKAPVQVSVPQAKYQLYRGARVEVPVKVQWRKKASQTLTLQPGVYGAPPQFRIPAANIPNNKNEGKVRVDLPINTPTGRYTLVLFANTRIKTTIKTDLVEETQKRIAFAEKKIAAWNEELKKLNTEIQQLTNKQKQLQQQIAKNNKDENLKKQKAQVDQQLNQLKQKQQGLSNQVKAAQQAVNQLKRTLSAQQRNARERDFNFYVPVPPIVFEVAPTPVKTSYSPAKVQQGQKAETVIKIQRLYGFTGRVDLQFRPPGGVQLRNLTFQPNQTEQKLPIQAGGNAPVGKHTVTVTLRVATPNGTLQYQEQFPLEVTKAPEKKK